MRRILFAALLAGILATSPLAAARRTTVKLATLAPDGSVWHRALEEMGADWQETSDGAVRVVIYPGGVSGDESDMIRKMRIGQLQGASISVVGLAQIEPSFKALAIPLFYDSYEEFFEVREALRPLLEQRLRDKGFVMLGWGLGGWVHVFTKEPVASLDGLRRVKMFTSAGDDRWVKWWKDNGFHPVPLAATDIMTGLQTGMIDGLPTTPLASLTLQWFRQVPYMVDVGLAPLVGATVLSESAWERLPEDLRDELLAAARETEATLDSEVPALDRDAVEQMKERGLTVVSVGDPQRWSKEAARLIETMRAEMVPGDAFDRALKTRDRYRNDRGPGPTE